MKVIILLNIVLYTIYYHRMNEDLHNLLGKIILFINLFYKINLF